MGLSLLSLSWAAWGVFCLLIHLPPTLSSRTCAWGARPFEHTYVQHRYQCLDFPPSTIDIDPSPNVRAGSLSDYIADNRAGLESAVHGDDVAAVGMDAAVIALAKELLGCNIPVAPMATVAVNYVSGESDNLPLNYFSQAHWNVESSIDRLNIVDLTEDRCVRPSKDFNFPDYCSRALISQLSYVYNGIHRVPNLVSGVGYLMNSREPHATSLLKNSVDSIFSWGPKHVACWELTDNYVSLYQKIYSPCHGLGDNPTGRECCAGVLAAQMATPYMTAWQDVVSGADTRWFDKLSGSHSYVNVFPVEWQRLHARVLAGDYAHLGTSGQGLGQVLSDSTSIFTAAGSRLGSLLSRGTSSAVRGCGSCLSRPGKFEEELRNLDRDVRLLRGEASA